MGTKLTIDMTGEKYDDYTNIPDGLYPVEVAGVKCLQSKATTNKYLEWSLCITVGAYEGKVIKSRTTLIKGKRWLFKQAMDALGVKMADEKFTLDTDELIGKRCVVGIKLRKNKSATGKEYDKSEVEKYMPVDSGGNSNEEEIPF